MSKIFLIIIPLAFSLWATTGNVEVYAKDPPTHLFAAWKDESHVYLGWRLNSDNQGIGYNVYRKKTGAKKFVKLNETPITDSTNFIDNDADPKATYEYQVCAVIGGKVGKPATVSIGGKSLPNNVYLRIGEIMENTNRGKVKAGDIDGDNLPDFMVVTRPELINEKIDNSEEKKIKHGNLHVKVYYNNGKLACDIDMGETELNSRTAWTLWDLNGDNRDELIGVMRSDPEIPKYKLYVIDPTGKPTPAYKVLASIDVPSSVDSGTPTTTRYKTISIAYLDGKLPHILYASGHQQGQTMYVRAYTFHKDPGKLSLCPHSYEVCIGAVKDCKAPTKTNISSSHQFEVADIDGDGKDEAFLGAYTFDEKGFSGFWGKHQWSHSDVVRIDYIRPGQKIQDVCFWLEQSNLGVHLTDSEGNEFCHVNNKNVDKVSHAHAGWTGNVIKELEGQEIWTFYKNSTDGSSYSVLYGLKCKDNGKCEGTQLFFDDGKNSNQKKLKNLGHGTVDWDGTLPLEVICDSMIQHFVISSKGKYLVRPIPHSQSLGNGDAFVMDIIGDYREEILSFGHSNGGPLYLTVYTNLEKNSQRKASPCESRQYVQRHRWSGH
jgi:hypothetical protein